MHLMTREQRHGGTAVHTAKTADVGDDRALGEISMPSIIAAFQVQQHKKINLSIIP